MQLFSSLLFLSIPWAATASGNVRRGSHQLEDRSLQTGDAYYSNMNLGSPNFAAALGNPIKGLVGGARWYPPPPLDETIPLSMEWFNVGVSSRCAWFENM